MQSLAHALLLCSLAAGGENARLAEAVASITAREIEAHVRFLADDLLEGRDSGHRGADIAALYLAARLRALGFRPLFDDFLWPFPLEGVRRAVSCRLVAGDVAFGSPRLVRSLDASASGRAAGRARPLDECGRGDIAVAVSRSGDRAELRAAGRLAVERGAAGLVVVGPEPLFEPPRRLPDPRRRFARDRNAPRGGGMASRVRDTDGADAEGTALLPIPAVEVARDAAAPVLEAAAAGGEMSIEARFEGDNRSFDVIGVIGGTDPEADWVFVGAHYDHVGRNDRGDVWNGADDNASGTAAVLEFAEALARLEPPPRLRVAVCFWGAEERGLVGSRAFAEHSPVPFDRIRAYLNLDMIGRNDPEFIDVVHSSDVLFEAFAQAARRQGLEASPGAPMYLGMSDTQPFYRRGVPVLFPFSGTHADYHTPRDEADRLDTGKAERVARAAFAVLLALADGDLVPPRTAAPTKDRNKAVRSSPAPAASGAGASSGR